MAAGRNFADKDIVTIDSLYRNSSSPYLTVPSPTPYDVPFSYNTCVTNDKRHIVIERLDLNGQPKTRV